MSTGLKLAASAATVFLITASMGSALTLATSSTTCDISDVAGSTVCEGAYAGNDSNAIFDDTSLFGLTGWKEIAKVDGVSGTSGVLTTTARPDGKTGRWSVAEGGYGSFDQAMVVVKAGNSFSAYLLGSTLTAPVDGLLGWSTAGVEPVGKKGNTPELSHFTLYGQGSLPSAPPPPVPPVPLPAAAWLLLAGLGGLGAVRRVKRT